MALQVWIPGTDGTLKNQGLYPLPNPSYNNIVSINNGKLGKDIKNFAIYHLNSDFIVSSWSICTWVKFSSTWGEWNNIIFAKNTSYSEDSQIYLSIINNTTLNIGRGASSGFTYQPSNGFQTGVWYHIAATCDGTNVTLYLNGSKVAGGSSIGSYKSALNLCIGCRSTNADGTSITGWGPEQNDIRLYDHCLSPKEVKEISKGLVLHYPLNDAYVEGTVNLGNTSSSYSNQTEGYEHATTSWGGDAGTVTYYKSGGYNNLPYKVYHKTASGSGGIFSKTANDISIVSGKTYTMSVWVKASRNFLGSSHSFNINGVTSSDTNHYITYNKSVPFTTEWARLSRTFTATESDAGMYGEMSIIYDNWDTDYYVYFSGFQIEEKDHATPYTPNTRNETTVYDCSGYQNNGTISGSLSCSEDSPRYKVSTNMSGQYISCNTTNIQQVCNAGAPFTISSWIKRTANYTNSSGLFEAGSASGNLKCLHLVFRNTGRFVFAFYSCDLYPEFNINNYIGEWNLITCTYDGSTMKVYINGKLTGSRDGAILDLQTTTPYTLIGKAQTANSPDLLSDFRIYAAALSEEDIKELYNTSCIINS